MQVLLVEPDKVLAGTLCAALGAAGHVVRRETEAEAAIHALDGAAVDVVILELQLAAHNGVEFLHELRSYPEWAHIPVIVHTVLPGMGEAVPEALSQLGVTDYLYKPRTTLAGLVQAIDQLTVAA